MENSLPATAMPETVTAEELDYVQPDRALIDLAVEALTATERANLRVVTAESCTAGLNDARCGAWNKAGRSKVVRIGGSIETEK